MVSNQAFPAHILFVPPLMFIWFSEAVATSCNNLFFERFMKSQVVYGKP